LIIEEGVNVESGQIETNFVKETLWQTRRADNFREFEGATRDKEKWARQDLLDYIARLDKKPKAHTMQFIV